MVLREAQTAKPVSHQERLTTYDTHTIGTQLLDRLHRLGVRHVVRHSRRLRAGFCINSWSPRRFNTSPRREDCAGFAADAYARINGIGASVSPIVSEGLNTVNAIACAYAERSPVVLLTGSPGLSEARNPISTTWCASSRRSAKCLKR